MAEPHSLNQNVKSIAVLGTVAAGTSDTQGPTTAGVDMLGFQAVRFLFWFGTVTASGQTSYLKLQDADTSGGTYHDVLSSSHLLSASLDSNNIVALELWHPTHRFICPQVVRSGANVAIVGILAELYRFSQDAVTQDASVSLIHSINTPTDGTYNSVAW
jgi:hypothetical protein